MATKEPPPRRRRRPRLSPEPQAPSVTTIHALGEDLLCEIFLRLPSLPSLVRAALACRAFLVAVRSSPSIRRRFRALHPPPLIGFFFESIGCDIPSFSPIRRRSDPDLAAAVRGADLFLTRLPYHDEAYPGWKIEECRGGYILLLNHKTKQIAAYNPLTRALHLLPTPPDEISDGCRGNCFQQDCFLLSSDETPGSFRVVCLFHDELRVRAFVYSSGAKEWRILPWSEPAPAQPSGNKRWLLGGTQASGNLYLAYAKQAYQVVLDTATMQFSIDLPEHLKGQGHLYLIGETKDGKPCMVSVVGYIMLVWFRKADADGVEKWRFDTLILLEREILEATEGLRDEEEEFELRVLAVLDGIVYLWLFTCRDPDLPVWFLSFCLETRKLEKLFHRTFDNRVFPYIMAWPSSLGVLDNAGFPAVVTAHFVPIDGQQMPLLIDFASESTRDWTIKPKRSSFHARSGQIRVRNPTRSIIRKWAVLVPNEPDADRILRNSWLLISCVYAL